MSKKKMGVKHVGIAPKGNTDWVVSDSMSGIIKRERAQVEGSICTLKSSRYGFNKPKAHRKKRDGLVRSSLYFVCQFDEIQVLFLMQKTRRNSKLRMTRRNMKRLKY